MSSSLSNEESELCESNRSTEVDSVGGDNFTAYESRFQSQRFDSTFSSFEVQTEKDMKVDDSSPQELLETQSQPLINESDDTNGPILPSSSVMEKEEEGFALREWRRLNALKLEEKEKNEKEMVKKIIEAAEQYKAEFYRKCSLTTENNKKSNREKEKLFLENQEKFYREADKNSWKAIAELIPREVPVIENRGNKKKKKQVITVIQGPKPGKPTDLSRMRQVLTKLKHNPPVHMNPKLILASGADKPLEDGSTSSKKL